MSTITHPKAILVATAALAAVPASLALLTTHDAIISPNSHQQFGRRPSFVTTKLEANRQPFSELDKLKAKRLSIRRPRLPEPDAAEAVADVADANVDVSSKNSESLIMGLEYLYEAGEERHSDDLFHIILMPSTFQKDHMSLEHAAESCTNILGIPSDKAQDLSLFAKHQGFSCLGTWTREECLSMGEELLSQDLDCRVIPFNGGVVPEQLPEITIAPTAAVVGEVSRKKAFVEDTYLLSFTS